jgi:hypothetical protein
MRPIGGELELSKEENTILFTDSGRSSLRLFIRSGHSQSKFLLPNFLCGIIEDVLIQEGVDYEFYSITSDLKIDGNSISNKEYDVLYLVNYFGIRHVLDRKHLIGKIIIEDNVFFSNFDNKSNYEKWFGFNSYRKVLNVCDGSLIKTNLLLKDELIENTNPKFVYDKCHAKDVKHQFIHKNLGSEADYLNLFEKGERKLNDQRSIHRMSSTSFYHVCNADHNQEQCKNRYKALADLFPEGGFGGDCEYYTFFAFKMRERDNFRNYLSSKGVYLPIHWPGDVKKNELYGIVISIPLSPVYTNLQFNHIIKAIKEFKL